jgi:ABC-type sugar transport system ATPase subunit
MIHITHDQVEAMILTDKIVVLWEGRIEQVGEPFELYERPANAFCRTVHRQPEDNFLQRQ